MHLEARMKHQKTSEMIGLAEAAQRLGLPYQDAHRLLLTGRLRGEKRRGRWFVFLKDVVSLATERIAAPSQVRRA
jgi:hypothetical protein